MKNFKKIFNIFTGQFLGSVTQRRVWVGYMLGILTVLKSAYLYQGYASGRVIQILEPFLLNFMSGGNLTLVLIGFMIIVSDALFVNPRSTLMLYRTSRKQWFWGMTIYIVVHGFLYYILMLLCTMVYSMKNGYMQNIWSRPLENHVLFPSSQALVQWYMPQMSETLIVDYTPFSALVYTCMFSLLYCLILAMVLFVFNSVFHKAAGTVIAAVIHGAGYMMIYDNISPVPIRWSLYYNSMFSQMIKGSDGLFFSVSYMLLILCLLLFGGPYMVRRANFDFSSGEKNE